MAVLVAITSKLRLLTDCSVQRDGMGSPDASARDVAEGGVEMCWRTSEDPQ